MWKTLILGRPLVFWDEEQIEEIKKQETQAKLMRDSEFKDEVKEYRKLESKKDEIENEVEYQWQELLRIAGKHWVTSKELYRFI